MGRQAAAFGLSDTVSTEQLEALLSGRDPIGGTPLGNVLVDRTRADGTVVRAVAGFDATLSAPKSLSAWWALTGDDRLAECHDVAVAAVVHQLERFGATTRVRHSGGRLHPDTQGLTIAAFRQSTSRADDPQLHTHLVISSKVQTDDGRWLALDARMLKGHQRAFGGLYQSVLRAELTHRFGVVFGDIVNGQAEIAGVPEVLIDRFSKRTAEVDRAVVDKLALFWKREGRDPTSVERAAITRGCDRSGRRTRRGAPREVPSEHRAGWVVMYSQDAEHDADSVKPIRASALPSPTSIVPNEAAKPTAKALAAAEQAAGKANDAIRRHEYAERYGYPARLDSATRMVETLHTWHGWATGHEVTTDRTIDLANELTTASGPCIARLAEPLESWLRDRGTRVLL